MASGRETPTDDESPIVCEARKSLTACMIGDEGRPNAHTVHILSREDITIAQASAKLATGPTIEKMAVEVGHGSSKSTFGAKNMFSLLTARMGNLFCK